MAPEQRLTATLTTAQWQIIMDVFDRQVVHQIAAPIIQALAAQLQGQSPAPAPTLKEVG